MKITSLADLTADQRGALAASVKSGEYNLFLGAGVSLDSRGADGQFLPSGTRFRTELADATSMRASASLQRAYSALSPAQVKELLSDRFHPSVSGLSLRAIPTFVWRRVFTLNIDDALEHAYETSLSPLQSIQPAHYVDSYSEPRSLDQLQVVHLHGYAREPEKGYVFSRVEYAKNMTDSNAWMTVLAEVMPVEPFIVAGTALDEVDLEFYLSKRSSQSPRQDKGPSFLVEPYPDNHTEREASDHGLILYQGTFERFVADLHALCPGRSAPHELLMPETTALLPADMAAEVVFAFASDFEFVPKASAPSTSARRFAYGHAPSWADLEGGWDIGRQLTARAVGHIEAMLSAKVPTRVLLIEDVSASGKSTVLRRVAYQFAKQGVNTLNCSALSRLEPSGTVKAIDEIVGPLLIVVDNFADQAQSINNILELTRKKDVVFVGAERSYRHNHIERSFGSSSIQFISGLSLTPAETGQLIDLYEKRGAVGNQAALDDRRRFIAAVARDPIAVACCHILKDMRPIDSIVESTLSDVGDIERNRFLLAALARVCFPGGVRYEVLAAASSRAAWDGQFDPAHPTPLAYYDQADTFVVPLNATMADRALERAPKDALLIAFKRLAVAIAPRVNRETIKRRSPEAKLAGRLFDYDDIIKKYLGDSAEDFYRAARQSWRWNSRYWEQVSLFHLSRYRATGNRDHLDDAIQHARHAVSIERHSFSLTTLGKTLFVQMEDGGYSRSISFKEAVASLSEAIGIERRRGRASVHAYVTLFRGALSYMSMEEDVTNDDYNVLSRLIRDAKEYFPGDRELREVREKLELEL